MENIVQTEPVPVINEVLPVVDVSVPTIVDKPIIKIIRTFDRMIPLLIIGDDKEHVIEHKNIGSIDSMKEFIDKNTNEDTTFLLQHDHALWTNLTKEGFYK